jgi:hypothetical protein
MRIALALLPALAAAIRFLRRTRRRLIVTKRGNR